MSKRFLCSALAAGSLVVLLTPAPGAAQVCAPLDDGRVAEPFYEGTVIFWEPVLDYREMVLTISGPCEDIIKVFKKGEEISFDIREITKVTDGTYTWQLRRVSNIDPAVQEKLEGARGTGEEDALWWSFFQKGSIPEGPYVDSASFTVERGVIVDPNQTEEKRATVASRARGAGSALAAGLTPGSSDGTADGNGLVTRDQVIPDDLIVQGSACVGFDCVNNESFGFDTIRLKENNLRIQFNDTSSGSFPTGNWQIRANSSASGGQSFLGFVDQGASGTTETGTLVFAVEAAARANALYVESDGDVGFGTSNPVLDLHISTANTPGIRLEQTNAGGFTAQTWDIAGNEANFFVRDVTGGSTLPFRIRPDAPTSSIDISADGNVGIRTASADTELTVQSQATNSDVIKVRRSGSSDQLFRVFEASTGEGVFSIFNATNNENIRLTGQAQGRVSIGCASNLAADLTLNAAGSGACGGGTESTINAGATQFTITSSRAIKENLEPVSAEGILDKLAGIEVYTYDFIDGPKDRIGLMAEDFHQVFGRGSEKMLDGQEVEMALWLAVRQLIARNEALSTRVATLEEQLATAEPSP